MSDRRATVERRTKETEIRLALVLDGARALEVATGLGFLDHMVSTLAFHAGWDLALAAKGDLRVDDHHTVEDVALALGAALDQALGDRGGIARFGSAHAPLDEALARAVVDLSGRPWPEIHLALERERIGEVACENLSHFFRSLAIAARASLHVDVIRGENDHHKVEAAFKATALALREALRVTGAPAAPSTKGTLV